MEMSKCTIRRIGIWRTGLGRVVRRILSNLRQTATVAPSKMEDVNNESSGTKSRLVVSELKIAY